MTKRCFVSIDLPNVAKKYLNGLQNPGIYWIKWMKPQNMHMTLNFLGDLNSQDVENAKRVLAEISPEYEPFVVSLDKVRQERDMLWIMPSSSNEIDEIQDALKDRLGHARLGKRERRSFYAHVLLAKSKTGRFMKWKPENFKAIEFTVDRINLYESELTPGAATHRLIQSFALNKAKT